MPDEHVSAQHDADKNPERRWRKFAYEELAARDKTSLDVSWLSDKSVTDLDNLPEPDVAEEIIEDLEAGLASFQLLLAGLGKGCERAADLCFTFPRYRCIRISLLSSDWFNIYSRGD